MFDVPSVADARVSDARDLANSVRHKIGHPHPPIEQGYRGYRSSNGIHLGKEMLKNIAAFPHINEDSVPRKNKDCHFLLPGLYKR